jgi:hypothetical protein
MSRPRIWIEKYALVKEDGGTEFYDTEEAAILAGGLAQNYTIHLVRMKPVRHVRGVPEGGNNGQG